MNGHYLMMRLIGQPVLYQPISAKQKFCDFRYGQNLVTDVTPSDAERGVQRRRMGMQHLVGVCYRGVLLRNVIMKSGKAEQNDGVASRRLQ